VTNAIEEFDANLRKVSTKMVANNNAYFATALLPHPRSQWLHLKDVCVLHFYVLELQNVINVDPLVLVDHVDFSLREVVRKEGGDESLPATDVEQHQTLSRVQVKLSHFV